MTSAAVIGRIEALFRAEAARITAALTRVLGDVALAEDCTQDALIAAIEHWPSDGMPREPGAWLMTTARNRALDRLRRDSLVDRKHRDIAAEGEGFGASVTPDFATALTEALDQPVADDILRLIFVACHPLLGVDARVALALRMVGGLTTGEIARAFLTQEATMAQRIVRAKRTLSSAGVPFELPGPQDLPERLDAVLEVIYLIYNEGYAASVGPDWTRPDLCAEALRLAHRLTDALPEASEPHALVALIELQQARTAARVDQNGQAVLLMDQDRARWDALAIRRGLESLERARATATLVDRYLLQAEIAACHAQARQAADTDWSRIAALYGLLARAAPSPVVDLNHAVAIGKAEGPATALPKVEKLLTDPALVAYAPLPLVYGDLLEQLGRWGEAAAAFERAAELCENLTQREIIERRRLQCLTRKQN